MDEGHIASADDFDRYKRRLDSIFLMPDDIMVFILRNIFFFISSFSQSLHLIAVLSCFFVENLFAGRQ